MRWRDETIRRLLDGELSGPAREAMAERRAGDAELDREVLALGENRRALARELGGADTAPAPDLVDRILGEAARRPPPRKRSRLLASVWRAMALAGLVLL
jgi:anti-sigma factor RsiW